MKVNLSIVLFLVMALAVASDVAAQPATGAAQRADDLRLQLFDVQAKEAELQARERQLNENMKPENIERSLAGIGSTRPEELREQRRRQLAIERDGVRAQLKLVQASRERLESSLRSADAIAYQQSAEVTAPPVSQALIAQPASGRRWLVGSIAGAAAILGLAFTVALIRRRSNS